MKRRFLLHALACFALTLGAAVWGARLVRTLGAPQVDLGGGAASTLSPLTHAYFDSLEGRLDIAFFVSSTERMPSHLKTVEADVVHLLEALRSRAPDRVSYRIIDPDLSGTEGLAYAARRKVSPLSVRQVRGDEQAERKVWSALVLKRRGGRSPDAEALIQGIDADKVPYLEELILHRLRAQDEEPRPVFVVAGGPAFGLLPRFLEEYGQVVEIDLEREPVVPAHADMLFWMQPRTLTPAHERALRAFSAGGGTAVLAGSPYGVEYRWTPSQEAPTYRVFSYGDAWSRLVGAFGVQPVGDLLLDRNSGPLPLARDGRAVTWQAPFHLRNLPAFRDMKGFALPARGGLNFVAAAALEFDPRRVQQAGFAVRVLATTTEHARALPLPPGPFGNADLDAARAVPRQSLALLLEARDPWAGPLVLLASASPLRDGIINQEGYGHTVFLRNLVRTFTTPERLALSRLQRRVPPTIVPQDETARLLWRAWAVFLGPAALLLFGLWRYRPTWRPSAAGAGRFALPVAGGLAVVVAGAALWHGPTVFYLDASSTGRNTPSERTLQGLRQFADLEADYIVSPKAALPPAIKNVEPVVHGLFARAGIQVRTRRPTAGDSAGLAPFRAERVAGDSLRPQLVWSGLRLRGAGRETFIPRLDGFSVGHIDFLVAAALERLRRGQAPRVAVIADLPRLSPAEALEDFQKKGLSAPTGTDVYSRAKALLAAYGYEVLYVNPRQPILPEVSDAVLWLQPRRDAGPLLEQFSRYLAGGGRAAVALQHFNIQQRQYRGAGFQTVYWPQPQFQDFDRYGRLFGVEQAREVLMDRTRHHLRLETQVNRSAVREYDPQQVALPFLIRAVGAHYAEEPLTRNLGDLLFVWGNRFTTNTDILAMRGIRYRPFISTSDRVWAYDWRGGWLPPAAFSGDPPLPPHQPLAIALEGRFPAARRVEDAEGRIGLEIEAEGKRDGLLLLIGASEMFKDRLLFDPSFDHAQFLLNAVTLTALGPETAALLTRQPAPQGFAFRTPRRKIAWRAAVVAAAPLLLGGYGVFRYGRRRRPVALSRTESA